MKRRKFIKLTAATAPLINIFPADLSKIIREIRLNTMEKRTYGNTEERLSILGFGGIVVMNATSEEAAERVSKAFDYGVNYFDVAPTYGDAELKLGPALEPYRKNVFLACKTTKRTAEEAQQELDQSLERLKTDYFDLYQLHAVTQPEEVETIFGPGGAMETFVKAREAGKIRFIGFSAHSVEAAMALLDHFQFDSILFPINYACWHAGNFGPQVLEKAQQQGAAILALKSMARRPYPEGAEKIPKCWYEPYTSHEDALRALRFTLSHPVTAAIPPGNEDLFFTALDLIKKFEPLMEEEIIQIKELGNKETPLFTYPMKS